jgi:hypothetical protein
MSTEQSSPYEASSRSDDREPVMEPEGSKPCSQVPTYGPYPDPDESRPHSHICLILVFSSHLHLGFPKCLFPSCFPTKTFYLFLHYKTTVADITPENHNIINC